MSKYQELIHNPYRMHHKEIKENAREVIFYVVSCMCDNRYTLHFSKKDNGDFRMSGGSFALSNFGFKHKPFEIEWVADEGDWIGVKNMINSGTVKVDKVISR
tara:strand:- start:65 stop:370 length:306 start_codon:yes stop_codon:yes gene_type:complete